MFVLIVNSILAFLQILNMTLYTKVSIIQSTSRMFSTMEPNGISNYVIFLSLNGTISSHNGGCD